MTDEAPTAAEVEVLIARLKAEYPGAEYHHPSVYEAAAALAALTAERDGAVTRGQMMLDAKNKYVVRATAAEAALAERDKLLRVIQREVNKQGAVSEETATAIDAAMSAKE